MVTGDDFDPIRWAIDETGVTVAEAVRRILTVPGGDGDRPATEGRRAPRPRTNAASQRDRTAEFVNEEYEVTAKDVVAYGITPSLHTARQYLSELATAGRIDRIRTGVYAPKGAAQEMDP